MKYRVGDLFISTISHSSPKLVVRALITREYESNGLRFELTFENKDGEKNIYTYNHEQLEYRFSEEYGWKYYPVVK